MEVQEAQATPEQMLAAAMEAHRGGQLAQARATYEHVLEMAPDHPDGLHLLGMLEGQFGSDERGVELIRRAIAVRPEEPMFHNNLGNIYVGMDRLDDAEPCYRRAIELEPERYDAINNLGVLLSRRGQFEAGEALFKGLLEKAPGFTDARENLAYLYLRQGRLRDALTQCAIGLVTAPRHTALRRVLGQAYSAWDMKEQAIAVYREWLKDAPDEEEPRHYLTALTGENVPERASDRYVEKVFDDFADSFDAKLAMLEYKAPQLVGDEVARLLGAPQQALRIADAGCGTGLCAAFLAPYASRLVGVDLSVAMLRKAAGRKVYHELTHGELVAFLRQHERAYDVLVSADTLCYFGVLSGFAAAARASLDGGGLLVFTVEADDDGPGVPDFTLHSHGRYSHRRGYVADTLQQAGLAEVTLRELILRHEGIGQVRGWLVTARVPAEATQDTDLHG